MCFRCDTDDESYDPLIGACRSCFDYEELKMLKLHVHAALIKAWADGAEIEVRSPPGSGWRSCEHPAWCVGAEYRIKPTPHKWQKEVDAFKAGSSCQWRWLEMRDPPLGHIWHQCVAPDWNNERIEFRIKPGAVVQHWYFEPSMHRGMGEQAGMANLKLTFENGVLMRAEVLK